MSDTIRWHLPLNVIASSCALDYEMSLFVWLGKSTAMKKPNTCIQALSLSPSSSSLWSRAVPPDARDWAASYFVCYGIFAIGPSLPLLCPFLPPWLYANPVGTEPVGEVGAGGSYLGGAHKDPRGSREVRSLRLRSCPLRRGAELRLHLSAVGAPWRYLETGLTASTGYQLQTSPEDTSRFPRRIVNCVSRGFDRRLSSLIVCWEVLPLRSPLFSFGLSFWMVDFWTQR